MIKKLWLFSSLLISLTAASQVLVTLELPPLGLTIKPQLWNLSLINTGTEAVNVRIDLVMTDASNNQPVMTAVSNTFSLPVGVKQVQVTDVSPVSYTVTGAGYSIDANPNGFLPVGVFHFCFAVTKVGTDAPERLGEECETVEIEPLGPPELIMPSDSEAVETTRPFFSWLPPSPFTLFSNLNYDWVLTEVMPMQSAADAIQMNIPVLSQSSVSTTNFQYPLAMPELDTSKTYAWRVTAKNNISFIANSEIWTFRVRKFAPDTVVHKSNGYYSRLRTAEDASYIVCSGVLRFAYLNELNSNQVSITIFDVSTAVRKQVNLDSADYAVRFGQNYLEMDLREYAEVKDRHMYLMELTNVKNEKWFLQFEYRKPD